ncbi:hypothetical protein [Pseudonocardia oroxyli]|uniref:Uncharacterized protein n=1 Tax=Pseudonocardia oroxyli TaxID=366584 RepID=A0A1G7WJB2_PSEOR|nr:hypothetical protein [Pseudonocardia oroxyli]SDG71899.1 hypothetical protein SAMN05216377_114141 [Pseudonocardia oroxyli]
MNSPAPAARGRRDRRRTVLPILLALLALLMVGACAGGSRSGSDQPGVDNAQTAPVSVNDSSEQDLAAALRGLDVPDPENWAQILAEYKPYAEGDAGRQQIQDVLTRFRADQETAEKISRSVVP